MRAGIRSLDQSYGYAWGHQSCAVLSRPGRTIDNEDVSLSLSDLAAATGDTDVSKAIPEARRHVSGELIFLPYSQIAKLLRPQVQEPNPSDPQPNSGAPA